MITWDLLKGTYCRWFLKWLNITGAICSPYFWVSTIFWLFFFFLSFYSNDMTCYVMTWHDISCHFISSTLPSYLLSLPLLLLLLQLLFLSHTFRWWRWRRIQCVPVFRYHRRCIRCCTRKRRHHGTARSTRHATPSKVRNVLVFTLPFSTLFC